MDYSALNDNPELVEWLKSLDATVASREAKGDNDNKSNRVTLPKIKMSREFRQVDNKTYPEYQGSINFLPISWNKQRIIELNGTYVTWCPSKDDWSQGFMYHLLEPQFYPEGPVRDKVNELREILKNYRNSHKDDWKTVKVRNFSLIKAFVIIHRNTKGDIITDNLFGGDDLIEHRNIPALLIFPVNRIQKAIQDDLNSKMNPVPFAVACYSDTPLKERQGWVSITFKKKGGGAIGYDCTASTDIVNPAIMPEGLLPKDYNFEDERIKLLESADPIKEFLDYRQVGESDGVYYNDNTLRLLEDYINSFKNK